MTLKSIKFGAVLAVSTLVFVAASCTGGVKTKAAGDAKVAVPQGACDNLRSLKVREIEGDDLAALASGYFEIVDAVRVDTGSDEPLFLNDYATISFDIPDEISKEDYDNLLGVCFREDGPVYFIPKAKDFKKGKISFETGHFTDFGLALPKDNVLAAEFVKRTAAQGWAKNISDAEFKKSLSERLSEALEPYGLGSEDLAGQIAMELVEKNEYTSMVADLVKGKNGVDVAVDYLKDKVAKKTVDKLLGKLMENPDNKDALEALQEVVGDKSELDDAIEKIRDLSIDGANDIAEALGEGGKASKISKKLAKDATKKFAEILVPYVGQVKTVAEATEKLADFWADNVIEEAYGEYKKMGPRSGGRIADEDWANILTTYMRGASVRYGSTHGLTNDQIRSLFENRASEDSRIVSESKKIEKYIVQWKEDGLLDRGHSGFGWDTDITQRMTMLYNVREKLRKEFVVNGDIPNRHPLSVEEVLDRMLTEYVACGVKDRGKFYEWALKQGYMGKEAIKNAAEQERAGATGEYVWTLRRVDLDQPENNNDGIYTNTFSCGETSHTHTAGYIGDPKDKESTTFVSTCTAPPQTLRAGQKIKFQATVTSGARTAHYFSAHVDVNFDLEEVGNGGISRSAVRSEAENVVGALTIGSQVEDKHHEGSGDLYLTIPAGSEPGELRAINYVGCGSRTHWVYQWGPAQLDTQGISGIESL